MISEQHVAFGSMYARSIGVALGSNAFGLEMRVRLGLHLAPMRLAISLYVH